MRSRESEEMYLETILVIKNRKGIVHSVDIVEELNYAKSSVSRGVNLLVQKGYITMDHTGELNFTEKGKAKADNIYDRHQVLTKCLEIMGVEPKPAEENACRIEHVISEDVFETIKNYVKSE